MNEGLRNIQNPIIRGQILRLCSLADQTGLGNEVIKSTLIQSGYDVTERDVLNAFDYLGGKGLIKVEVHDIKALDFKRHMAYILPEGIDVMERRKVIEGVELQ